MKYLKPLLSCINSLLRFFCFSFISCESEDSTSSQDLIAVYIELTQIVIKYYFIDILSEFFDLISCIQLFVLTSQ